MVKDFSAEDWQRARDAFDNKCAYCGESAKRLEQEHFVSVLAGGTYTKKNIIPSCPKCNGSKHDKDPFEWLVVQEHGLVAYARITQYLDGV
jgi:5-methylcytosine-specific restriction endonuclease McrA